MRYLYNDDDINEIIEILLKAPRTSSVEYILEQLIYQGSERDYTITLYEEQFEQFKEVNRPPPKPEPEKPVHAFYCPGCKNLAVVADKVFEPGDVVWRHMTSLQGHKPGDIFDCRICDYDMSPEFHDTGYWKIIDGVLTEL